MRLSDLIGKDVVDAGGQRVGVVTDVPLVREGPVIEGFGPSYTVVGLRVSARGTNFFGYEQEDAGGPAPVRAFFRWLHRGDRLVEWAEVADVGDDRITLQP